MVRVSAVDGRSSGLLKELMTGVVTNLSVYLAISEEALAESVRLFETGRTRKANGEPGYVIAWDPEHKSFKQSLIAIAFAGMYLEALLSLVGNARLGKILYNKISHTTYEEKLSLLGVYDLSSLASCKRFRTARNDLMHEKAVDLGALVVADIRMAQEEAVFGLEFVKSIRSNFLPVT